MAFFKKGTVIRAGESPRIHRETFYKMMAFLCEDDNVHQNKCQVHQNNFSYKIIFHIYFR